MFRMLVVVIAVLSVIGCGGKQQESAGDTSSGQSESESRSMIPEKVEKPSEIVGVSLVPRFDEAGNLSEFAVAKGQRFEFFVIADVPEPFHTSASQFSVELPAGVTVVGTVNFHDRALTMGDYLSDYAMAYQCAPPGKFYLVKFTCETDATFAGGMIRTREGVTGEAKPYIGFVTCEEERLPAAGGTATLNLK